MRRLLGVLAVTIAALTFGIVASRPAPPSDVVAPGSDFEAAANAIEALLDPASGVDPIALLPADFTAVEKVVPGRMRAPDGTMRAVHADGGCSTPLGDENTRWDYSVGCKAHDLGYDLLRYAEKKGHPLPADLRRRLDDQLSRDMHKQCELNPQNSAGLCAMVADVYTVGLVVNSWHQRWGPPRAEPISSWAVGLIVVIFLFAGRPLWNRRANTSPCAPKAPPVDYMSMLRVLSMAGIVVGETVLAFTHASGFWLLQLAPLLFFAGGHANVLAWRSSAGDYGAYLAIRIHALLRPVFAFVLAWLLIPLTLELLDAPEGAIASVGSLVLEPLWVLGIFLITVAACPAMEWLYERFRAVVPVACLVGSTVVHVVGSTDAYLLVSGLLLALGFGQLAFHWEDGPLRRVPRPVLIGVAVAALVGFVFLRYLPLLGIAQVSLACTVRNFDWIPARAVGFLRSRPMTVYLVYVGIVLLYAGLTSSVGLEWFARPRTWLAVSMITAATLVAFFWYERRPRPVAALAGPVNGVQALACALGVGYATLGVLGFAVTGVTWHVGAPALVGMALDPLANLIHLMLGGYLLHVVHTGKSGKTWPWLLTAAACVPPILSTWSPFGTVVHGATVVVALTIAGRVTLLRLRTKATVASAR
ncbi:phospholipase [Kibdelosporangium philippinense]|uniref:Phospholipase n=1 Tax=Kibdelosporangium philippinense TaxID=211113 RepID=A0ABS8ZFL7_9PSEU|nr:phospholipase A2 [Kibdelosporangium philippinense]MCE7006616.1 phospholipase [Kibdelosporangium philippinense]